MEPGYKTSEINSHKTTVETLLQAKYDPTIPEQAAIVDRYVNRQDIIS